MSVQNFSFLARLEVAEKFVVEWWWGGGVGWWWWGGGLDQFQGSALVKLNNYCSEAVEDLDQCGTISFHLFHVKDNYDHLGLICCVMYDSTSCWLSLFYPMTLYKEKPVCILWFYYNLKPRDSWKLKHPKYIGKKR